jgi:hypothetical protein
VLRQLKIFGVKLWEVAELTTESIVEGNAAAAEATESTPENDPAGAKSGTDEDNDPAKSGRPPMENTWKIVDAIVRRKAFKGPSACARKVHTDLRKHQVREEKAGRPFDLPAQHSVRNYVSEHAERLGIAWQSRQSKSCTK